MRILFCFLMAGALVMGGCTPADPVKAAAEKQARWEFGFQCINNRHTYEECRSMCIDRNANWQQVDDCRRGAQDAVACPSCGPTYRD